MDFAAYHLFAKHVELVEGLNKQNKLNNHQQFSVKLQYPDFTDYYFFKIVFRLFKYINRIPDLFFNDNCCWQPAIFGSNQSLKNVKPS